MDQSNQRAARKGPDVDTPMPCGLPDAFPAHVVIVDPDGYIAYASNRFIAFLGAARPKVIGQNLSTFLSGEARETAMTAILGQRPMSDVRHVLQRPDGSARTVMLSADRWIDPDGRAYRVIDVADVTAQQEAEERLRLKSIRLQSCIEGTDAGTWEWNVQTGETRFNERWADIVGYRLEELEPVSIDTWKALAHPDDMKAWAARLEDHFSGKTAYYDVESRMRHRDGHDVWIRDRGRVFTWTADGKPEWMFGTHFLIDAEKRSRESLLARHALLDRVANLSGVGAWELEIGSKSLFWSNETKRIHGVADSYQPSVDEGINFYAPEARPVISSAVEEGMKSGKAWDLELPLIRKDGQRIWVRAVGNVEFENEAAVRIIGSFQDITEKVRDRNELIAAKEWTAYAAAKGRVGLWSLDTILGELNWDAQMTTYFGFRPDDQPKSVAEWMRALGMESRDKLKDAIRGAIFDGADLDLELSVDIGAGDHKVLKLVGAPHRDQESFVDRIQGACFDLTEHRHLTARLQEEASKLSVTLTSIGDGVITTDETGRVTWMNPAAEKITGRTAASVAGQPSTDVLRLLNEKTRQVVACPIEKSLKKRATVILEPDSVLLRPDGTEVAIEDSVAPLLDADNRIIGAVMVFRDTTLQRIQTRETAFRASHDSLTGLLNRDAFLGRLDDCLADPLKRNGSYLFFIDVDHFKRINDSIGHAAGDAILACIADVLRDCVDESAAVSRLGGDEFAILLRARTQAAAEAIGQKICRRVAESTCLKRSTDKQISIGTSIGIVSLTHQLVTTAEALRMADIAAYSAKNNGRGQACVWNDLDGDMLAMSRQTSLIDLIEAAISDGSWCVQEQCIQGVEGRGDGGAFAELLIRLPDGNGGMISPSDFLPAAERYGMMQDIDLWMCAHALDRIRSSVAAGTSKRYSVNISSSSICSETFRREVVTLLSLAPDGVAGLLCIEVAETTVLSNLETCRTFLAELRSLGVRIAIDDFGAGSTAFRHFQNFPADFLKIDGSFIGNMMNPIEDACITCFLRMAEVAHFRTIAEHVEDEDQIAALTALKVDYLQGYAVGRPV